MENNTAKTPLEDLRVAALKHYEEASNGIHHWSSFVEKAIKAYNPINQEGSLNDWKEKIKEWDNALDEYPSADEMIDFFESNVVYPLQNKIKELENVLAPLLQNKCKGDDLVSSSKSLGNGIGDAVRSTVETQIEQDKKQTL